MELTYFPIIDLHIGWLEQQFDRESFIVHSILSAIGKTKGDFQSFNPYRGRSESVAQAKIAQDQFMEAQAKIEFGVESKEWGLF